MKVTKSHVVLSFRELAEKLGLPAEAYPVRVWAELDNDYLHIISIHGIEADEGFVEAEQL